MWLWTFFCWDEFAVRANVGQCLGLTVDKTHLFKNDKHFDYFLFFSIFMKHKGSDCDLTQSEETGNNFNEKFSHILYIIEEVCYRLLWSITALLMMDAIKNICLYSNSHMLTIHKTRRWTRGGWTQIIHYFFYITIYYNY